MLGMERLEPSRASLGRAAHAEESQREAEVGVVRGVRMGRSLMREKSWT